MYNKKVLIDSLKKLGSAKAPTQQKDMIIDPMGQWAHPGENTRIPSNNITMDNVPYPVYADPNVGPSRMMYPEQEYNFPGADYVDEYPQMRSGGNKHNHVVVKPSKIQGADKGLFSNQGFKKGQLIGLAHRDGQPVGKIGNMHNHSDEPNMYSIKKGNQRYVYAKRDIQPGEELTTNYRLQPELEQPEDFMRKGGSAPKLPRKKNSKGYSRSLEATNRLFAKHSWFAKPKSRKNKIYDPNAKYYANGGESRCPEGYAFNPNTGECIEWNPTIWNTVDEPTSFDPVADIIYMNPNDRPDGISDEQYNEMYQNELEHEQLHRLQWLNGELQGQSKTPLRMPSPVEKDGIDYYNRRAEEVDYIHNYWKGMHPHDAEFIPDEVIYNNETNPAMYQLPWTAEGEARYYQDAVYDGMQSFFPKRKQGGEQLPRAQFGLTGMGKDRVLTATPFDFRTSYGQSTDFYKNPNYSLTYTTPNLFKMNMAANPLSFTIGSPYHTDKQRLTSPQLDMNPIYRQDYYDPAFQAGSGPQYQQYLQDVSNYSGTPVSGLNQTILNQYNAAKNLAAVKPTYKKGIPLTGNVEYGIYGNAGPFIGALNLGAGYAPEPGFYGTMDTSAYGVFGKRKHNKTISRKTYFDNGLTRQGDRAWIPRLNIFNMAVKQHPDYNDTQTQKVLELYNEDIQQGTTKAEDFLYNDYDQTSSMPFGISALSPELTFQVKPFKDIPGVLSLTAGLRNTLGGKDKAETTVGGQWTSRPYGNIRYSIPLEGAIDKLKDLDLPTIKRKKTYNDYADDQEYDEEYTDDTPQEDASTENNIEVNPPELQVNPNGTVLGRGDCPEGYERPCSKCRCQKIKMPQMYTDKRGTHLFGNEPIRFQSGGEQEAMNAMMKARLAYANMFGNPAAQRMINIPDQPYEFDNGDMGTHYMASIDNYAVPQIQNENGQLMLGNYGPESREAIRFDSDEDANYFAENYKDVSPGFINLELTEDQIEEYRKGGYIIEDISVPSLTKAQKGLPVKNLINTAKNFARTSNIGTIGTLNTLAKTLAPIMINPARIPMFGAQIDKVGPFTGSPLNVIPFYGKKMESTPGTAFRKFGDTLDYVKFFEQLNPAHGPLLRMGKDQIMSEGNWAELNEPNEQYSGVFGAQFDTRVPGSDLSFKTIPKRNGVLVTDASGNLKPIIPLSEPGLSFHRRLPFSNRYIPVDMNKLRNDQFDWRTVGGNTQSLLERYGYAAGYAGLLGALGFGAPKEYLDEYINEPIMQGYNKYIKPGVDAVYDVYKPIKLDRQTKSRTIEEYAEGGTKKRKLPCPPFCPTGVKTVTKGLEGLSKIDKLHIDDFANLSEIIKNSAFSYPLTIEAPSGFMKLIPNDLKNIDQNLWHFLADMPNQREAGKAFHMFNQILPPKPSILETDSFSLDSLGTVLNMGKKKDWIPEYENDVHLNSMSKNSDLFKGLPIPNTPYGLNDSLADQMVERLTKFIQSKGYDMDAYRANPPGITNQNKIYVPNYRITRTWELGGNFKNSNTRLPKAQSGLISLGKTVAPIIKPISSIIKSELPSLIKSTSLLPSQHKFVPEITQADWAKWNKATPDFSKLMAEYADIEEFTKGAGTWMKNLDGTPYSGSPLQFIQEQSSYFKKAFPEGYERVFRGVNKRNAFADFSKGLGFSGDRGIFASNPELALKYALHHSGSEPQLLNPFVNDNVQGVYELIYPKGKQIIHDAQGGDWKNIDIFNNTTSNDAFELERLNNHFRNIQNTGLIRKGVKGDIVMPGQITTNDLASFIPETDLNSMLLKNITDGGFGDVSIINSRPGNYLKSRIGNTGFFKMDSPHIYKNLGGESNYELGDEVDEATMKQLKELGYTFEKI